MSRENFGTTATGLPVERITLDNGVLRASILTFGATLQDLRLHGLDRSLTLGSPRVADYEPGGPLLHFGSIAGPVANRISGATAGLDGQTLTFEPNGAGGHALHGGKAGLGRKVWTVEKMTPTFLLLSTTAADGEGGFPGNRRFEAEFALSDAAAMTLTLRAGTDAPTLVNLTNHSYWNLSPDPTFHLHELKIDADAYLPTDADAMVTGEILAVDGTPFDFRTARVLSEGDTLDHNFCLARRRGALAHAVSLTSPDGVGMEMATTEPGVQIYDGRHLPRQGVPGLGGRSYGPRAGVAIETQLWPDAPNNPDFPSARLDPGQAWEQITRFRFILP